MLELEKTDTLISTPPIRDVQALRAVLTAKPLIAVCRGIRSHHPKGKSK